MLASPGRSVSSRNVSQDAALSLMATTRMLWCDGSRTPRTAASGMPCSPIRATRRCRPCRRRACCGAACSTWTTGPGVPRSGGCGAGSSPTRRATAVSVRVARVDARRRRPSYRRGVPSRSVTQPACNEAAWRSSSNVTAAGNSRCGVSRSDAFTDRGELSRQPGGGRREGNGGVERPRRRVRTPTPDRARRRAGHRHGHRTAPSRPRRAAPTAWSSIQVCPPPGCSPIAAKRESKRADSAGEAHVAAQRQVEAGADRRAVDGGDGRQGAVPHPQEPVVDRPHGSGIGLPPSPRARRFDVSAPEQNAGGLPVTTNAPTASSASASSTAATIASTIGALKALRRASSSRVSTATPSRRSTCRVGSGAVAHHRGRVAEEVLDVALVAVLGLADRRLEAQRPRERVDRARRRVLVRGSPPPGTPTCRPPARSGGALSTSGGRSTTPRSCSGSAAEAGEQRRQRHPPLPDDRAHLAPRHRPVTGHVEDARHVAERGVGERPDDVVLVHELQPGVEAEDLRARAGRRSIRARGESRCSPEHVREPQLGDRDVRVVLGEVADDAGDLEQRPLDPGARRLRSAASSPGRSRGPRSSTRSRASTTSGPPCGPCCPPRPPRRAGSSSRSR